MVDAFKTNLIPQPWVLKIESLCCFQLCPAWIIINSNKCTVDIKTSLFSQFSTLQMTLIWQRDQTVKGQRLRSAVFHCTTANRSIILAVVLITFNMLSEISILHSSYLLDLGYHLSMYNIDSDYMFSSWDIHCSFCTWESRILTLFVKRTFLLSQQILMWISFAVLKLLSSQLCLIYYAHCVQLWHCDKRGSKLSVD